MINAQTYLPEPQDATVTLTMDVAAFRLLDAVQYYFLGGGLDECLQINNAFREARTALGVEKLPKTHTDQGFGVYFDASKAYAVENGEASLSDS